MNKSFFFLLIVFFSCNTRKDLFEGINQTPEFKICKINNANASSIVVDSAKLNYPYKLKYYLVDEENIYPQVIKSVNNKDSVDIKDSIIIIIPKQTGDYKFDFQAKDSYEKTSNATLNLTTFDNLMPVCNFLINPIQQLSLLEIEIDASNSYDRDQKWGGIILKYEFTIDNKAPVILTTSKLKYIFSSIGVKPISVRVQDNNGAWSEKKTIYYTLN